MPFLDEIDKGGAVSADHTLFVATGEAQKRVHFFPTAQNGWGPGSFPFHVACALAAPALKRRL